jgi:hypothetical protein
MVLTYIPYHIFFLDSFVQLAYVPEHSISAALYWVVQRELRSYSSLL